MIQEIGRRVLLVGAFVVVGNWLGGAALAGWLGGAVWGAYVPELRNALKRLLRDWPARQALGARTLLYEAVRAALGVLVPLVAGLAVFYVVT